VVVRRDEVLDVLTGLVDKSLVVAEGEPAGEPRYRLLETLRQYAGEKLLATGEAGPVRARHRDWYLAWAERAEPELRGRTQDVWLRRFDTEHDNLRAALAWSQGEPDGVDLRLVHDPQGVCLVQAADRRRVDPRRPAHGGDAVRAARRARVVS